MSANTRSEETRTTDPFPDGLFPSMYDARDYEIAAFGERWIGPKRFKPWEETHVATFEKHEGGDGQTVNVYCSAAPARFYKLHVLAGANSCNEPQAAYKVCTGSGAHQLAADLAKAIAEGMIGFEVSL